MILVRNHEVNNPGPAFGPGTPYDPMARGGTTTVQVTPTGRVIGSFTSLNGTMMNCSGGRMPWGAWVTCEETVNGPDVGADFTGASNVPLTKPHGYVFEVPVSHIPGHGQSKRKPITHAGRFAHEAVSFDPKGGHLYLTEDNFGFPSGFYRYRPPLHPMQVGKLLDGGTLQMLKVKGVDNAHLEGTQTTGASVRRRVGRHPRARHRVRPTRPASPRRPPTTPRWCTSATRAARRGRPASRGSRARPTTTASSTSPPPRAVGRPRPGRTRSRGYGNGSGQVWGYDIKRRKLTCLFQSPGPMVLDLPDNVTTSKHGTLVVCEDNVNDNFIRGLTRRGQLFDIALNRLTSSTGADRVQRRVRGFDVQPERRDPVREHPGRRPG